MANLQMLNDYVLVKLIDNEKKSSFGIILTSVEPPCTGVVVSVGEGKTLPNGSIAEHNIKEDDVIVFGKASLNTPLEHEKNTYYVMRIEDIFGKKNA